MLFSYFAKLAVLRRFSVLALTIFVTILFQIFASGQTSGNSLPAFATPHDRITSFVDDTQRIAVAGDRYPLATSQYDAGAVASTYPMDRMVLTLLPDAAQQNALDQLLEAQQDPESPYYHQWLTPEEYGERFGVSDEDTAQVIDWLSSHGMQVEEVTAGRRSIVFSGTAGLVEGAFHTQIHTYKVGNEVHHANASDPEIPEAFAGVVGGVVSLHDFRSKPMHNGARLPTPEFTASGNYYLAPADFATIYDLGPLYQQGVNGSGQSIAIVARSNINLSDARQFRSSFGLPANDPQIILNGSDPGTSNQGEETEADLDAEWSGAVASRAAIKIVVSKSTNSSDGSYLSAQYIVSHNLAPVMSMSFGLCEAALGSSGNNFFEGLWQQAAAQGITVFVSAGDSGAAGCDAASASRATHGRAVNGICSTPYNVCVGGTEFNDRSNPPLYWSPSNASGTQSSALSYIPEVAWNESVAGGLWAGGGGVSTIYGKPSWQTGRGVPTDGKRDLPDVSLTGAGHDGYLIYQNGGLYVVGGTSASSPSFAGLMAMVVQGTAARQGNANTVFYSLAGKQGAGGAAAFHDTLAGNNGVPGQSGFSAGNGYDQATGLGSVDASVLAGHWSDATAAHGFHAAATPSAVTISTGSSVKVDLSVTVSGGFDATIAFTVSGLPRGITATFTPLRLAAPGSGSSILKLTAAASAAPGAYSAAITTAGGSSTQTIPLAVICSAGRSVAKR